MDYSVQEVRKGVKDLEEAERISSKTNKCAIYVLIGAGVGVAVLVLVIVLTFLR